MTDADFLREMSEFYNCARIFKPMTGFMASRFTTSKTTILPGSSGDDRTDLVSKPEPKAADPAEEAAKMGMFGAMTRTVEDFYPTRLLCKRFNVKPPAHVKPDVNDSEVSGGPTDAFEPRPAAAATQPAAAQKLIEAPERAADMASPAAPEPEDKVDPGKNEAVEGTAAHAEVLRAIFGDSDSE
jgi:G patch domain-containing protein 1